MTAKYDHYYGYRGLNLEFKGSNCLPGQESVPSLTGAHAQNYKIPAMFTRQTDTMLCETSSVLQYRGAVHLSVLLGDSI